MSRSKITIPRELLLIEIERRCSMPECNAKTRLGLTKNEARSYTGFNCERCDEWNEDLLKERDVPEWWEELAVTDLYALRKQREKVADKPGELIRRMSDGYRLTKDVE